MGYDAVATHSNVTSDSEAVQDAELEPNFPKETPNTEAKLPQFTHPSETVSFSPVAKVFVNTRRDTPLWGFPFSSNETPDFNLPEMSSEKSFAITVPFTEI